MSGTRIHLLILHLGNSIHLHLLFTLRQTPVYSSYFEKSTHSIDCPAQRLLFSKIKNMNTTLVKNRKDFCQFLLCYIIKRLLLRLSNITHVHSLT